MFHAQQFADATMTTTTTIQQQIVNFNPELKTDYSRPNSRVPSK
jgi:hypothetical protein